MEGVVEQNEVREIERELISLFETTSRLEYELELVIEVSRN